MHVWKLKICLKRRITVLVLAGMELIFFLAAHIVLCFVFLTKTQLLTHQGFSYCWTVLTQHQGHLCFSNCMTCKEFGRAQEVGRGHRLYRWPQMTKEISHTYKVMLSNKISGKVGEMFMAIIFVFLSNFYKWWALLSCKWLDICLPMGSNE